MTKFCFCIAKASEFNYRIFNGEWRRTVYFVHWLTTSLKLIANSTENWINQRFNEHGL